MADGTDAQSVSPATGVRVYTPFTPGGELMIGVAVPDRASGTCFAPSSRCSAGNAIPGPCFAPLDARAPLACSRDPWSADATLPTVRGRQPSSAREPVYGQGLAQAPEWEGGQRCGLLTGATAPVAGLRVNYGCPDGGVVVGGIDCTLPRWRMFHASGNRSLFLTRTGVKAAWYREPTCSPRPRRVRAGVAHGPGRPRRAVAGRPAQDRHEERTLISSSNNRSWSRVRYRCAALKRRSRGAGPDAFEPVRSLPGSPDTRPTEATR